MRSLKKYDNILGNAYFETDLDTIKQQIAKLLNKDPELIKQLQTSYDKIQKLNKKD